MKVGSGWEEIDQVEHMSVTAFNIDPIIFNGTTFSRVELTVGAQKPFLGESEKYFRYIVAGLDGASLSPMEYGEKGEPIYYAASATSLVKGIYAESKYRKTVFTIIPETQTIVIYHSSSLREKQYNKLIADLTE